MNKEKINTTPTPSLTILYDNIRWEEKALFESSEEKRYKCHHVRLQSFISESRRQKR